MNRKAFTLIELLAVIVILAIIALIAVPIVINIINDSKEESEKRSVQNYLDAVTNAITQENLKTKYDPDTCVINEKGNLVCSKDEENLITSNGTTTLEISISGEKPIGGTIYLKSGKILNNTNVSMKNNNYIVDEKGNLSIEKILEPGLYDENNNLLANWEKTKEELMLELDENGELILTEEGWDTDICNDDGDICYRDVEVLNNAKKLIISDEVKKVGDYAFVDCVDLKKIVIPKSVISIGEYALDGCKNLESVSLDTSGVWISNGSILDVRDSKFNVIYFQEAYNEYPLIKKDISLEPGLYNSNLNLIANWDMLVETYNLDIEKDYYDGDGTGENDTNNPYCVSALWKVLSNNALQNGRILVLPNSITKIGSWNGTGSLTSILISNSVKTISDAAFVGTKIESFVIPESVNFIGSGLFFGSDSVNSVAFKNTEGWFSTRDINATTGTVLDVTDPIENATKLLNWVQTPYWKRN